MTVRENLIAARALLDTPEKWADSDIIDALDVVTGDDNDAYEAARWALRGELDRGRATSLVMFNNARQTQHADIVALFDRAIASCEVAA